MEEQNQLNFIYGNDVQKNEEMTETANENENLFNRLFTIQKLIKRESVLKELCKKT